MCLIHMYMHDLQARISCDVRWQLASEPVDVRYIGSEAGIAKPKAGHYGKDKTSTVAETAKKIGIDELKEKWGLCLNAKEEKCLDEEWGLKIIQ